MSFYNAWLTDYYNEKNCTIYVQQFMEKAPDTVSVLLDGEERELHSAYKILKEVPIKIFFDVLLTLRLERPIVASDVLQYSSFYDAVCRVPELLEFYPRGTSFVNIGYQIVAATKEAANRKYGENHSRLAEALNLVTVSSSKPRYSRSTAWGHYLIQYTFEEKEDVYRKLLLREYFLQNVLQRAVQGATTYFQIVPFLAETTALRRRSNTHHLVDYLLRGTDWESYLDNIDWK